MQHQKVRCADAAAAVHVAFGAIQVNAREYGTHAFFGTSRPQGIAGRASWLEAGAAAPGRFKFGKGGGLQKVPLEQCTDVLPTQASAMSSSLAAVTVPPQSMTYFGRAAEP